MSSVQVRPFRRDDRDQLTGLVNAHAAAVVPGMSVSVNSVLGSLGRQPGSSSGLHRGDLGIQAGEETSPHLRLVRPG
jgi:hypothetical protein